MNRQRSAGFDAAVDAADSYMLLPHLAHVLILIGRAASSGGAAQRAASGWLLFSLVMERSKAWHITATAWRTAGTVPPDESFRITFSPPSLVLAAFN
jgi:hypothetical protein